MTTYADPSRCPDCRSLLGEAPQACPRCALPLTGPSAVELFATFQRADLLISALQQQKAPTRDLTTTSVRHSTGGAAAPLFTDLPRYPAARPAGDGAGSGPDQPARGVSGSSVPKILLTLGALCLLVAAVTFLAVAWSLLGVGGRTVVLVGLTGAALAGGGWFVRRGLRMAAESVTVVGLGLVALDVVGARHAGWLGDLSDAGLLSLLGAVVATVSLGLLAATMPRPLMAPAVFAPLGILVAGAGFQSGTFNALPMVLTTVTLIGLARVGSVVGSTPLRLVSLAAAALGWVFVVIDGLVTAIFDDTVTHLWGHAAIWPLVVAVGIAAGAGPTAGLGRLARLGGYSVAALLGSWVVVLVPLGTSQTVATTCLLALVAVWTGFAILAPRGLRAVSLLPLGGTVIIPVAALLQLVGAALAAVFGVGRPFSQPFDVRVSAATTEVSPWLALVTPIVLTATGCAVVGLRSPLRRRTWLLALGVAAVAGAALTLPLYDVPLAAVVGLLLAASAVAFAIGERFAHPTATAVRAAAVVPGLLAVLAALPNDVMTTLAMGLAVAVSATLMLRSDVTGGVATGAFAIAVGGFGWAAGSVASVPEAYRAVPVLLVLGGYALWRPEPVVEVSAATVAAVVSLGAVLSAGDVSHALAVHLTVAGAVVTASALIHPSRRFLAWPGGVLLMLATWVRLAELGVSLPEAYTLPAAFVLIVVGCWRLLGDEQTPSLELLTPGLLLATVPSLLVSLDDPTSLRALLLGLGCLGLALAGAALRWGAPLVVGSVVGALLVLREIAPYAAVLPSWIVIGWSGAVLLTVGITWEARMREVRTATRYVARLR